MTENTELPSLNALRSFAVAARYLSFTKAAEELHVTPGAINRLVKSLEEDLGERLLERSGHSLRLTPTGSFYYPILLEAFDLIATATRSVKLRNNGNILSINVPSTFAMRWLLPRLPAFQVRHPEIFVDIKTKDGLIHFSKEKIDVAVFYGNGHVIDGYSEFLMSEKMGIFCSPLFLKRNRIKNPQDLIRCTLLQNSTRPDAWNEYFLQHSIPFTIHDISLPTFEHFFMVIEAAIGSMGAAILPIYFVQEELHSGKLVQPISQIFESTHAYYIAHARINRSRKVKHFVKWLLEVVQAV